MRIGDEVYIHGYVDEIRQDTIIIRNNGGYFGTDKSEVIIGNDQLSQNAYDRGWKDGRKSLKEELYEDERDHFNQ